MQITDLPGGGEPGFEVAGGDVGQISVAQALHSDAADMLEMHAAVVWGTAKSLESDWQSQAGTSYQDLSNYVHSHFNLASDGARTAAAGLGQWKTELERCQKEGNSAMLSCRKWLKQQQHWFYQWQDAKKALAKAQAALSAATATNPFTGATTSNGGGGFGGVMPSGALSTNILAGQVSTDTSNVASAEAAVAAAKAKLDEATTEVLKWQARGRAAWDDAMQAAEVATGTFSGISVPPPPLAGLARVEPHISKPESLGDEIINTIGNVTGVAATVTGVVAALTSFIPVVDEATASVALGASVLNDGDGWAKAIAGEESWTTAATDTAVTVVGYGGGKVEEGMGGDGPDPDGDGESGEGAGKGPEGSPDSTGGAGGDKNAPAVPDPAPAPKAGPTPAPTADPAPAPKADPAPAPKTDGTPAPTGDGTPAPPADDTPPKQAPTSVKVANHLYGVGSSSYGAAETGKGLKGSLSAPPSPDTGKQAQNKVVAGIGS